MFLLVLRVLFGIGIALTAKLLKVEHEVLQHALLNRTNIINKEAFLVPLTLEEV